MSGWTRLQSFSATSQKWPFARPSSEKSACLRPHIANVGKPSHQSHQGRTGDAFLFCYTSLGCPGQHPRNGPQVAVKLLSLRLRQPRRRESARDARVPPLQQHLCAAGHEARDARHQSPESQGSGPALTNILSMLTYSTLDHRPHPRTIAWSWPFRFLMATTCPSGPEFPQ